MSDTKRADVDPRFDLTDKTIIVTGGGKGIGKVYVEEIAKRGANVFAADIDGAAAEAVVDRLSAEGWRAHAQRTDIADAASVAELAQAAMDKTGRIDVLINNASLMSVLPRQSWLEIPLEEWDRVMAVNLRGMFLCCRAAYPAMKEQGPRQDRQHRIEPRVRRHAAALALHDLESRRDRLHARAVARGRADGHYSQRDRSRQHFERNAGWIVFITVSGDTGGRPGHSAQPDAGGPRRRSHVL